MNFNQIPWLSPLTVASILLIILIWKYVKAKRGVSIDKVIEIIAFGFGAFLSYTMLQKAFITYSLDQAMACMLFTGAVVTLIASARGTWVVLTSIKPRYEPQKNIEIIKEEESTEIN